MEPPRAEVKEKLKKVKVTKPKRPKKVHPKKYICYSEGCNEEFGQWKLARDHMEGIHEMKDPKLKKSIVYLDAKGDPKVPPRGAPKATSHYKQQCDTIKLRETPKVLTTAPQCESYEGHRGNDLGQFGPNWIRSWGTGVQFPHLRTEDYGSAYGNNVKNVTMDNPQLSLGANLVRGRSDIGANLVRGRSEIGANDTASPYLSYAPRNVQRLNGCGRL